MTISLIAALCQLILAVCFATAGAMKLREGGADPQVLRQFGVPEPLVLHLRRGLPLTELAVGLLLAWTPTAHLGGVAAAVLLMGFTTAFLANLFRGNRPTCSCFGSLSQKPIGTAALIRNIALLTAAGVVTAAPAAVTSLLGQALLVSVSVIAVQAFLLARSSAQSPTTVPEAVPEPLMSVTEGSIQGLTDELADGQDVLALFIDPGCAPCHRLLPLVSEWQRRLEGRCTVRMVSRGDSAANTELAARHGLRSILVQQDFEVARRYGIRGTPGAVLLDRDGRPISRLAAGTEAIMDLIDHIADTWAASAEPLPPPPQPPAEPNPDLPTVLGVDDKSARPVPAADPDGRWTLVIGTAAHCPDCDTVLAATSRRTAVRRHRVVVLSEQGDVDVDAVVAVDAGRLAARALRLTSVPSVVVLDGEGRPLTAAAIGTAAAVATITALTPAMTQVGS